MPDIPIRHWNELAQEQWSSLLLGNGASIALHPEFRYPTLHSVAHIRGLLPSTGAIFARLGTTDFEHVLLSCWYAEHVNTALGSPSPDITRAYAEVRSALIAAVHAVHPVHADVLAALYRAAVFASRFNTVITLNYDVTIYWAMLLFNATNGNWFKDAFVGANGAFNPDWGYLRQPFGGARGATLVFYPHGSLTIARDHLGRESKLMAGPAQDLLRTIADRWMSGYCVPVFVSEGTSAEKFASIRRSHYLTNVYDGVVSSLGEAVVIYGWGFDERDQHILAAISRNAPRRIAVSVYTGQPAADQQAYCHRIFGVIRPWLPYTAVDFFDSQSPACWSNP